MNDKYNQPSHPEPTKTQNFIPPLSMVDFFGALIPGTLFLVGMITVFFPVFHLLVITLDPASTTTLARLLEQMLQATNNTPGVLWVAVFGSLLGLAYLNGHMFSRQDVRVPNRKSFKKLAQGRGVVREDILPKTIKQKSKLLLHLQEQGKENDDAQFGYIDQDGILTDNFRKCREASDLQLNQEFKPFQKEIYQSLQKVLNEEERLQREFGCAHINQCDFPFINYDKYLKQRKLYHLLPFILWKERDNRRCRSKVYINILKVRMKFHFPRHCTDFVRNEAHVRLASSSWYASRALNLCCCIAGGLYLSIFLIAWQQGHLNPMQLSSYDWYPFHKDVFGSVAAAFSIFSVAGFAFYTRYKIESSMHYMRIREIFFVLESAFNAFKNHTDLLVPPFYELDEAANNKRIQMADNCLKLALRLTDMEVGSICSLIR